MKQSLVNILALVCYGLGIDALFYWLNRKAKRIITFHDVLPDAIWDRRANGVSCSESSFKKIVFEVQRRFALSLDMFDAKTVTFTFDDGYLNQYEIAARILQGGGVLFVTGSLIDAPPETALRNTLMGHWQAYVPMNVLEERFGKGKSRAEYWRLCIEPVSDGNVLEWRRRVVRHLDSIWSMSEMFKMLGDEYVRLRFSGIKHEQLDDLRRRGWIIGYHTANHLPMSALSEDQMREEMSPPDGFAHVVFSYPYGELKSVDERAVRIAEELGYPCAVSNLPGRNRLTGRFFLPRMSLSSNKYRLHFQLSGLEYFIKTRRLLPVVENKVGG